MSQERNIKKGKVRDSPTSNILYKNRQKKGTGHPNAVRGKQDEMAKFLLVEHSMVSAHRRDRHPEYSVNCVICNFWTFRLVIQLIKQLFKI